MTVRHCQSGSTAPNPQIFWVPVKAKQRYFKMICKTLMLGLGRNREKNLMDMNNSMVIVREDVGGGRYSEDKW